jgi:hypothetical protein
MHMSWTSAESSAALVLVAPSASFSSLFTRSSASRQNFACAASGGRNWPRPPSRQPSPRAKHLHVSRQPFDIQVLNKLLAADEIMVTEQLPLVGPSCTQILAVGPQGAPQALNKGSFDNRNFYRGSIKA